MSKKEYVLDSLFEDIPEDDYNPNWSEHKERVRQLLIQGAKGFAGGCLFVLVSMGLIAGFTDEPNMFADPTMLLMVVFAGIGCIGFPYGWSLINKAIGNWSIFGNAIVVFAFFWFKAGFSLILGIWVYPIVLVYNLIKSQKSKRKIKRAWIIIAVLIVVWIIVAGVILSIESKDNSGIDSSAASRSASVQLISSPTTSVAPATVRILKLLNHW